MIEIDIRQKFSRTYWKTEDKADKSRKLSTAIGRIVSHFHHIRFLSSVAI